MWKRSPAPLPPRTFISPCWRQTPAAAPSGTGTRSAPEWRFIVDGQPRSIALDPGLITNSADVSIGHAERGGGLTMVLAYQVVEALRAGRLAVVLAAFEAPPLPIHLVYPSTRLLSAKVRAFVDLALETCDWEFVDL